MIRPRTASRSTPLAGLPKVLAHTGIASRRDCEQIILAGRVQLNGRSPSGLASEEQLKPST